LTLINCIFKFNSADEHGGGLYHASDRSRLLLASCTFIRNRTTNHPNSHGWGGGIFISSATGKMKRCIVEENLANEGGGVFFSGTENFVLLDCRFIGNRAESRGGGILSWNRDTYMPINCMFIGNSARNEAGAIFNTGGCHATLINCLLAGNTSSSSAGAISNWPSSDGFGKITLTNCTLVANRSRLIPGGLRDFRDAHSTLTNCILWANKASEGSFESNQIYGEKTTINYCCIQGLTNAQVGTGNFRNNPLFVDPNGADGEIGTEDDNFRLEVDSPCINSGDNKAVQTDIFDLDEDGDVNEPIPIDLDGKPRILNGTVDIGAYESG
jgi:hypothetical protein